MSYFGFGWVNPPETTPSFGADCKWMSYTDSFLISQRRRDVTHKTLWNNKLTKQNCSTSKTQVTELFLKIWKLLSKKNLLSIKLELALCIPVSCSILLLISTGLFIWHHFQSNFGFIYFQLLLFSSWFSFLLSNR